MPITFGKSQVGEHGQLTKMIIYGLDPGGAHNGWVHTEIRDRNVVLVNALEMTPKELEWWYVKMLSSTEPAILVVEDYIIQPAVHGYSHEGDKGVALRLIGGAQLLCLATPCLTLELQSKIRKPLGYGYLGEKYVKGKQGRHILDALAHVMYYAVQHKLAEPTVRETSKATSVQKVLPPRIFRAESHSQWRRPGTDVAKDK